MGVQRPQGRIEFISEQRRSHCQASQGILAKSAEEKMKTLRTWLLPLFLFAVAAALFVGFAGSRVPEAAGFDYVASGSPRKPVHVREYTRKDGTVVHAHERAAPARTEKPAEPAPAIKRTERGRIERSAAEKHEFEREHPCPSTNRTSGGCPGYVVDHIKPLACGGVDGPSNMQWQTVEQGKIKDRYERAGCR